MPHHLLTNCKSTTSSLNVALVEKRSSTTKDSTLRSPNLLVTRLKMWSQKTGLLMKLVMRKDFGQKFINQKYLSHFSCILCNHIYGRKFDYKMFATSLPFANWVINWFYVKHNYLQPKLESQISRKVVASQPLIRHK